MSRTLTFLSVAVLAACGNGGGGGDNDVADDDNATIDARPPNMPGPDASPAPYCKPTSGTNLRLQLITDSVMRPVTVAAPNADGRLFIVEQVGRIRVVKDGLLVATPFLTIDVNAVGDEQGLLGLAFHPNYATNGRFFVFYVRPDADNGLRIAEYHADPTSDVADTTEKVLLDIPHHYDNHNGGTLVFGNDGLLYISVGDGGAQDDYEGNGQNMESLKAKILRIDVDSGDPYSIPSGNPWAAGAGQDEMFAWGLRNPYRIAVDRGTGDIWIGDVGQGTYEEVDVIRAGTSGQNFGWPVFEGPDCFGDDAGGTDGCDEANNYVMPVTAYNRVGTGQCSVVMAGVYRGTCMPDMAGRVFFGDYCSGEVRSFPATSNSIEYSATTDHTNDLDPGGDVLYQRISGFGVDGYAELYVTALQTGDVFRIETE
jgi:glucose/arabinose dehydrogenase